MASFEEVYRECEQLVYRFLLRLCGDHVLAEELTQETFYQALRHWKEFRGESSAYTWLCSIAKRQYCSCMRKPVPMPIESVPEPAVPDIADALADSDRTMIVHRHLHALPEPLREVFMLRTFGELSHGQIGGLFGKSDSWARVTYYRARHMLIQRMKEENDENGV